MLGRAGQGSALSILPRQGAHTLLALVRNATLRRREELFDGVTSSSVELLCHEVETIAAKNLTSAGDRRCLQLERVQAFSTQADTPLESFRSKTKNKGSKASKLDSEGSAESQPAAPAQAQPQPLQQETSAAQEALQTRKVSTPQADSSQLVAATPRPQVAAREDSQSHRQGPVVASRGRYALARATTVPFFLGNRREPMDVLEAIRTVQAGAKAKFDETVEVAMQLGTDPKKGEQQVRGAVVLPHGTGKAIRVCVFAEGENAELAKRAGADLVGSEELIEAIAKGELSFDKCLATSEVMPRLSKVARILGPRGLMPNVKLGTLVDASSMPGAIQEMKGGRVEYRADRTANVHAGIGKVSFPVEQLYKNMSAFVGAIMRARPKGVKGSGAQGYILKTFLSSTMGSSVPVNLPSVLSAVQRTKQ